MITVPEKTLVAIPIKPDNGLKDFDMNLSTFLRPLNTDHKRDWFSPHFYHCLPLSIGNMQGFAFSLPFDLEVIWNGNNNREDIYINAFNLNQDLEGMNHVHVRSEFGHGIFTVHMPILLKTSPGVNLMTIAPPNFPTPGITPMTGVIETDNLRFTFTLNFKVDVPNIQIIIKKDYPIMCLLPIPRRFSDSFQLVNGYDIMDKDWMEEERDIAHEHGILRNNNNYIIKDGTKYKPDAIYYKGKDVRGNKLTIINFQENKNDLYSSNN